MGKQLPRIDGGIYKFKIPVASSSMLDCEDMEKHSL